MEYDPVHEGNEAFHCEREEKRRGRDSLCSQEDAIDSSRRAMCERGIGLNRERVEDKMRFLILCSSFHEHVAMYYKSRIGQTVEVEAKDEVFDQTTRDLIIHSRLHESTRGLRRRQLLIYDKPVCFSG